MSKLIVINEIDDDEDALNYAMSVVAMGKVGMQGDVPCYCFVTKFFNDVVVHAHMTKAGTHIFRVTKQQT